MGAILFSLKFADIYKCTYWSRIESLKSITIINNLRHDIGLNLYKTIKHRITYNAIGQYVTLPFVKFAFSLNRF